MKTKLLLIVLLITSSAVSALCAPATTCGKWTVTGSNQLGDIYYDSILIATPGMLQLFAPGYKSGYFSTDGGAFSNLTITNKRDGLHFTRVISTKLQKGTLNSTETCDLQSTGIARFRLKLLWTGTGDAVVEWNPVLLNISPFVGAVLSTRSGEISSIPYIRHGHPGMLTLASGFHHLVLRGTAVGDIHISANGMPPSLGDGRNDPYLSNREVLWPGLLGITAHPGQPITCTIGLHIVNTSKQTIAEHAASVIAYTSALPQAVRIAQHIQHFIIPEPKHVVWMQTSTVNCTHVILRASPNIVAMIRRGEFTNLNPVAKMFGIHSEELGLLPDTSNVIQISLNNSGRFTAQPPPPRHEEGYSLTVRSSGISAKGHDTAGIRWALETLLQVVRSPKPGVFSLQQCNVSDWPSMHFRGVHLFVGKQALPFHTRLLMRILAPLKINRLVLECEYAAWKHHPELITPFSMPLTDLHHEVTTAKDLGVTPIPLIETLGHSQWLFTNHHNLALAEDPKRPYAYDATNLKVYKIIFNIFGQALKVFDFPREFHIGHDEVKIPGFDGFGEYPARPNNVKLGLEHLFVGDVLSLHNWLARHGVKTMMWGDMLLNREEGTTTTENPSMQAANAPSVASAIAMRRALPKDITICDWRYGAGSEQRNGLAIFQKDGFPTIGASWYEPANIQGWANQIIRHHAKGLLQTTWDGYDSRASLLNSGFRQYAAFVEAADAAWSGHILPGSATTGSSLTPAFPTASAVFRDLYEPSFSAKCSGTGWSADLSSAANTSVNSQLPVPWVAGTKFAVPSRLIRLQSGIGIAFNGTAVMFHSSYSSSVVPDAPTTVDMHVAHKVFAVAFLHALTYPVPEGTVVANIVVHYMNGKMLIVPVRSGFNICPLNLGDPSQSILSQRIPCEGMGKGLMLRSFTWYNPNPTEAVGEIAYRATSRQTSVLLFGATGVSSR